MELTPDTAARRNGGYESGDGPLPDPESLPTGPAPGAQTATATAAGWLLRTLTRIYRNTAWLEDPPPRRKFYRLPGRRR